MDPMDNGPEFDDRLIKLVKENAAIYDSNHPNYRRPPVRTAIWDNIAKELKCPSKIIQTKWKNIRYSYIQYLKSLETGVASPNIRKKRYTDDLSFLKHTAFRRQKAQANGLDDSNAYMYPDNFNSASNTYEVIELDQSEDEGEEFLPDVSSFLAPMNDITAANSPEESYALPDNRGAEDSKKNILVPRTEMKIEPEKFTTQTINNLKRTLSPTSSNETKRSSPLPKISVNKNLLNNGNNKFFSEVTIRPLTPTTNGPPIKRRITLSPPHETLSNSFTPKNSLATPNRLSFNNDPIEMYCLSLADSLRAMPRSERERVKFEFAKILKDAHYKDEL